jgi:hypothetical protein
MRRCKSPDSGRGTRHAKITLRIESAAGFLGTMLGVQYAPSLKSSLALSFSQSASTSFTTA